jgi:hypothetical protein
MTFPSVLSCQTATQVCMRGYTQAIQDAIFLHLNRIFRYPSTVMGSYKNLFQMHVHQLHCQQSVNISLFIARLAQFVREHGNESKI